MDLLHVFAVCVWLPMFVGCLDEKNASWPSNLSRDKGLRNILLTDDGNHLIVSGLYGVYNLNTSNFQLLNQDITGTADDDINDKITIMIYNRTDFVTTCSSSRDVCDVRNINDVSMSAHYLEYPIKIEGAKAFMASYTISRNQIEDFLFVACPHVELNPGGRCEKPGIAWYKNSGDDKDLPWYGFKSFKKTPVYTEKYIDAFIVHNYRIFFSIQKVKETRLKKSRIAQVCQFYVERKYTTRHTYADMPIHCGDLKEIQAVKKVSVDTKTLFIAVFSDAMKSAVCVYPFDQIKNMFVANIKDCYKGSRVPPDEDYINFPTDDIPCTRAATGNDTLNKSDDDYFLCNKDNLAKFDGVIGSKVLSAQPVVRFNTLLTAITVTHVETQIVAFLGTSDGKILKAVVYPNDSVVMIKQPRVRELGDRIQHDMFTSFDKKHIFVLSPKQVFNEPVQICSEFSSCAECLGSKDPYCGWCYLENKCGANDTCINSSKWLSVSGDEKCPHILRIDPTVMSDKEIEMLTMDISVEFLDVEISCSFYSEEVGGDFNHTVPANISDAGVTVQCMPNNTSAIENRIKGFLNVTVSLLVNDSDSKMKENFIIYGCETFDRCIDCTASNWTCKWCTYTTHCIDNGKTCTDGEVQTGECPRITNYTMVSDGRVPQDNNGTIYLSRDSSYKINITGTNLPIPRPSVNYACEMIVAGTRTLSFKKTTYDDRGNIICNILKENMVTITEPIDVLQATIHVTWGSTPVYGDAMSVTIYVQAFQ